MDSASRISPAKSANLKLDFYEKFDEDFFNSEFIELVITGVPTDDEGKPIWESVDDLLVRPYSHGLMVLFLQSHRLSGQLMLPMSQRCRSTKIKG